MKKLQKISIIIPVFNEQGTISELINRLSTSLILNKFKFEIIVVDDNSTDRTSEIVKKASRNQPVIYLQKKGQKGKAFSLVEGFKVAKYDNIAFIDADLQYPPEEIPQMALKLGKSDIVVANRKKYKENAIRRFLSRSFKFLFGNKIFGLSSDIQSGLKVFKREVIETIKFIPTSQWTFDLEFLHRANQAGFKIINHNILFKKRKNGDSSIKLLKTSWEIGSSAFNLRLTPLAPVKVKSISNFTMRGAGVRYKKKKYITHTTMPFTKSSIITFTGFQKFILALFLELLIVGLVLNTMGTLTILMAILSSIYFADTLFNFFVVSKSLHYPQEILIPNRLMRKLRMRDLPIYTILCPLYKEAHIIPQFVENISKLDWPKRKLDVMLLLEEDDKESIEKARKMDLPHYVRIVVVPNSQPKTKPKACNYGLSYAKGEYLVIFDAEDMPEPKQLKKAYLSFKELSDEYVCLQAKLNYYNPSQNLLTRFFTAEYSLWFDVTLTGLQSINTSIPLGGTSNHFRVADLKKLHGWDPFNVTEDADLGMRLFKDGYKTAIIDSTTLEEANSKWGNWVRQRSRWIKGYMQTYLVHTRGSLKFAKEKKIHYALFHLIMGGKIAFILINPILWIATISYFTLYSQVGPTIEALYPPVIFYMACFSLVFGNFLFMYYYMVGVMKRKHYSLLKYTFLIPFYWLMISVAGSVALYQLFFKPFYWEKTVHGLHLGDIKDKAPSIILSPGKWTFIPRPAARGYAARLGGLQFLLVILRHFSLTQANSIILAHKRLGIITLFALKKVVVIPIRYAVSMLM